MEIKKYDGDFTICKLEDTLEVNLKAECTFLGITDEEISLVCPTSQVPGNTVKRDDGWKAMRIQGEMPFDLVGILAGITAILAGEDMGIFAVSTYNTDYILVKEEDFETALSALARAGHTIV